MPEERSDIGTWLGIGAVAVFFLWLTRKPYRLVIFVAMLGAGGWWATWYEAEQQQERSERYQQKLERRAEQQAAEEAALPQVWYQQTRLIAAWEDHLGSLPEIASSEVWSNSLKDGRLLLDRSAGGKLEKLVGHTEIAPFVEKVLPAVLSDPAYQGNESVEGVDFLRDESSALDFLAIRRDTVGLYEWDGRRYGQDAYGLVNPVAHLPVSIGPETETENDPQIAIAYASWQDALLAAKIQVFEDEYLPRAVPRERERILRKEPGLGDAELNEAIRNAIMQSNVYRELTEQCPDYDLVIPNSH